MKRYGACIAVYGNLESGFSFVGPFNDFDAADEACPDAEWIASLETRGPLWSNDLIQFSRLIAEMEAAGFFSKKEGMGKKIGELLLSTDLTVSELAELTLRAQSLFDRVKESQCRE